MFTLIRKNQQVLMVIITVLVIIAFAWLYNSTDLDKLSQSKLGTVYGKELTVNEFQRQGRMLGLTASLGFQDVIRGLSAAATSEQDVILNTFILNHQADELQLQPTEAEVADVLRTLPVFQTNGVFDFGKYGKFIEEALAPQGFTEQQLEEAVRTQIRYSTLRSMVDTGVLVSEDEVRDLWNKGNAKLHTKIVRITESKFSDAVEISEEDISKYYENRKDTLNSDEQRKVKFVRLALSEEDKKLEGTERIQKLQALADTASALAEKMLGDGADFEAIAREFDLKVETTGLFTAVKPDPALAGSPALAGGAFTLTSEAPNSDPIQDGDGFAVLHLAETVASRPLTLDEAREEITSTIKQERTLEAMEKHADELRTRLTASLKAGKSFSDAAIEAGVEAEALAPFTLSRPDMQMTDWMQVMEQSMDLGEGELSSFFSTSTGGGLLYLEKSEPGTSEEFDGVKASFITRLRAQKQQLAWSEWISAARKQAGIALQQ